MRTARAKGDRKGEHRQRGTDATATITLFDGQVMIFAAIDQCTAECVELQPALHGARFEALEPRGKRLIETPFSSTPCVDGPVGSWKDSAHPHGRRLEVVECCGGGPR
jgi:hypothetical protein